MPPLTHPHRQTVLAEKKTAFRPRVRKDPCHDRQGPAPHRVPGSQLPQPVRMLLRQYGHLSDPRRHLHPQLPLLQHRRRPIRVRWIPDEPRRVAEPPAGMNLRYVVVTSVTRDDLEDGGCRAFCRHHQRTAGKDPRRPGGSAHPRFSGRPVSAGNGAGTARPGCAQPQHGNRPAPLSGSPAPGRLSTDPWNCWPV
jgi:hypothetical protein